MKKIFLTAALCLTASLVGCFGDSVDASNLENSDQSLNTETSASSDIGESESSQEITPSSQTSSGDQPVSSEESSVSETNSSSSDGDTESSADTPSSTEQHLSSDDVQSSSDEVESSSEASSGNETASFDGWVLTNAKDFSQMSGIQVETDGNVGFFNGGDWLAYEGYDFGTGAKSFKLGVAGTTAGGTIEVRLGSATGTLIGSLVFVPTTQWYDFTEQTAGITETSGVHNLYLVAVGGEGICNINTLQLSTDEAPTAPLAPSELQLNVLGENVINASWTDNSDNETGFNIYWSRDEGRPAVPNETVGADVTSFELTDLRSGTDFNVWITAANGTLVSEAATASAKTDGTPPVGEAIKVMSLNIWGHKVMSWAGPNFANLIKDEAVDIVGIQEGVEDWNLTTDMPTNYSRVSSIMASLGGCYENRYQIIINTCNGLQFNSNYRWDMTDGANATRTGETAIVSKNGFEFAFVNIHWEAFSSTVRDDNTAETAAEVNKHSIPVVTVGDFNDGSGVQVGNFINQSGSTLIHTVGLDYITAKGFSGTGYLIPNSPDNRGSTNPSDHPSIAATLTP